MTFFEIIFGAIFIAIWGTLGIAPWLVASVATRGRAGLGLLPLCVFAAIMGGMLVPFLGFTGVTGIWISFAGATALPSFVVIARRFAVGVLPAPARESATSPETE